MNNLYHLNAFIVWENFAEPKFYLSWLLGLLAVALFSFTCQLISGLLLRKNRFNFKTAPEEFVIRFTLGISLIAFLVTAIALFNQVYPFAIFSLFVIYVIVLYLRDKKFVNEQALIFIQTFTKYKWYFVLFLISSILSLLPPIRYDEMSYHLAYIHEFLNNRGIITDASMRHPLYTFNWHMIQLLMAYIHPYIVPHLLTCLTGLLTSIAISELLNRLNTDPLFCFIAGLSFFVTPLIQHNLNYIHIDVPQMFFMLTSLYLLLLARNNDNKYMILAAALCCAMFIGIKISNFMFIPALLFIYLFRNSQKQFFLFAIVFGILSSTWYIRNYSIAGDPISPILNITRNKPDPFWSKADFDAVQQDVKGNHDTGLLYYLKLPLSVLKATPENEFADWPLLGYVLLFPFLIFFLVKDFNNEKLFIYFMAIYGIILWLSISVKIRYEHHIAIAIVAAMLAWSDIWLFISGKISLLNKKSICVFFTACVFIGPTASAFSYFKNNLSWKIPFSEEEIAKTATYNQADILTSIDSLKKYNVGKNDTIYSYYYSIYKYYFIQKGYSVTGDFINKNRFSDFEKSIRSNKTDSFLSAVHAKAIWLDKARLKENKIDGVIDSLINSNHFSHVILNNNYIIVATIKH